MQSRALGRGGAEPSRAEPNGHMGAQHGGEIAAFDLSGATVTVSPTVPHEVAVSLVSGRTGTLGTAHVAHAARLTRRGLQASSPCGWTRQS